MEIIAVYNLKGGVGKTTTAVNLAYLCARSGWRTLLWDLDQQGAATWFLRGKRGKKRATRRVLHGERELDELIHETDWDRLDLLPASRSLQHMDEFLLSHGKPEARLMRLMRPLNRDYACLVLDCPPGLSLTTRNVLRATDLLLVPLLPSPLSARMLAELEKVVDAMHWQDLSIMPFFSMVDSRRTLHRSSMAALRARYPTILDNVIPYSSVIEQASARRAPLPAYAPANPMSLAYDRLWAEIDRKLDGAYRAHNAHPSTRSAEGAILDPIAAVGQNRRQGGPGM